MMNDILVEYVKVYTRRGKDMSTVSKSDRPWNDAGGSSSVGESDMSKPLLRAIVLDFSTV